MRSSSLLLFLFAVLPALISGACSQSEEPDLVASSTPLNEDQSLIQGRLLDENNVGISKTKLRVAAVSLPIIPWGIDWDAKALPQEVRTDSDGYFEFAVPASTTGVRVGVIEGNSIWYPWQVFYDVKKGNSHLGMLQLPSIQTIRGVAQDSLGNPLASAAVRIAERHLLYELSPPGVLLHEIDDFVWTMESRGLAAPKADTGVMATTTDADGNFEFRGRFLDPHICLIDPDGIPHAYECGSPDKWANLSLKVHSTHQESFEFITEDGDPAVGADCALVVATHWWEHEILMPVGQVPPDGKITIATEGTNSATVAVRNSIDDPWLVRSSFWEEGVITPMVVPKPRDLIVRVEDENSNPVPGAKITTHSSHLWLFAAGKAEQQEIHFEEIEPGTYRAKDVPPHELVASIQAEGFMEHWHGWQPMKYYDFDPDWNRDGAVTLHRSASLEISMTSGNPATPVQGALIHLGHWRQWSSNVPICEIHDENPLAMQGLTDKSGIWKPAPLCSHGSWVSAKLGISIHEALWDGSAPKLTLAADFIFNLSGTIRYGDQPLSDARITISDQERNDFEIRADRNGRFATTASKPGNFVLKVHLPKDEGYSTGLLTKEISIKEAGSLHLDLKADIQ